MFGCIPSVSEILYQAQVDAYIIFENYRYSLFWFDAAEISSNSNEGMRHVQMDC